MIYVSRIAICPHPQQRDQDKQLYVINLYKNTKLELKKHTYFYMIKHHCTKEKHLQLTSVQKHLQLFVVLQLSIQRKLKANIGLWFFELGTEVSIFFQGHCCYNLVSLTFLNSCYIESIILVNKGLECKSRFGFD